MGLPSRWRGEGTRGRRDVAGLAFLGSALLFGVVGIATAVWISRANVIDRFCFGPTVLWSAMDPAGFYFADVVLFFQHGPVEVVAHPGLPMTLSGALLARLVYGVRSLFSTGDGYVDYWVRHRILLNGLLAGLANAMLLACCHPLFRVRRHVMDRSAAFVGCMLFLGSVPVLLYVSRFSPEAWMLYFMLWSIHLSLQVLDGEGDTGVAIAMGACTSLAVLSKWLALPVVVLNCHALLSSRTVGPKARWRNCTAYFVSAATVGAALLSKVSFSNLIAWAITDAQANPGVNLVTIWSLPYERPLVVHDGLVVALGVLGLIVMHRAQPDTRAKLGALTGVVGLLALGTLRRPFWHYLFGFYWLLPAAAAYGLTLLVRGMRGPSTRRDVLALGAGLAVIAVCDAWEYPGLLSTYGQYLGHYRQRAALVREHPAWVAAPWEVPLDGFEVTLIRPGWLPSTATDWKQRCSANDGTRITSTTEARVREATCVEPPQPGTHSGCTRL